MGNARTGGAVLEAGDWTNGVTIGAEVAAGLALVDLVDDEVADLGAELVELGRVESPQVGRGGNVIQDHGASLSL